MHVLRICVQVNSSSDSTRCEIGIYVVFHNALDAKAILCRSGPSYALT